MSSSAQPPKAVFFDLDGTLLRGTTVSKILADWTGHAGRLDELEHQYATGAISNAEVANASAAWFSGRRAADACEPLASAPWIDGIEETVQALRDAGTTPLLATVTWSFAAAIVAKRYGFEAWCGTVMATTDGLLTGTVDEHFDAEDKKRFAEAWCNTNSIPLSQAGAVGDSRSDVPLFKAVGHSIALNGDEAAREAAHTELTSDDLRDVLAHLQRPSGLARHQR